MSLNPTNIKYFKMIVNDIGTESPMDISARCIVCGDSHKNPNKKRLHLYTKTSYESDSIQCFNCGYTASVYKFIEVYGSSLLSAYRSEMGFNKIKELQKPLIIKKVQQDVLTFKKPEEFINIQKSKLGLEYLIKRKIKPNQQWYVCNGVLKINKKEINLKDFIIIPLLNSSGDWYGFYSRNLKQKYFYTYLLEENQGYKVWNYFNINKKQPVYIFESIMDALSTNLTNSISCLGADINEERLKELIEPIFIFDNDKTGKEKALKYSSKGYKVFIWPDVKEKDCNEMLEVYDKEYITNIIMNNIFEGFTARMKLMLN